MCIMGHSFLMHRESFIRGSCKPVFEIYTRDIVMSFLDKAKELSNKVSEKAADFSSDELIADTIIKAVEKQERVYKVLQEKGSSYRVNDIDLEMGIPPKVVFGIRRVVSKDTTENTN